MTVFGLQWTQGADSYARPAESHLTDLAITSPTNAATLAAVAHASQHAPWSGMRRCNLWDDGTPTAYYGDRCYTDTDVANMGQAMVQIPKFWYTTNHGGGVYIWYISDTGADALPAGADHAWAVHPAFLRDGATKSYIYLGAYEGYLNGTKLESRAGYQPKDSLTRAQFRTSARLRKDSSGTTANYWEIPDYNTISAIDLLYLVEYGRFNSSLVLSAGVSNLTQGVVNKSCTTGHTTSLGNTSGDVPFTAETQAVTTHAMSYRGIENFYGNIGCVIDGIKIQANYKLWVADHDFNDDVASFTHPYVDSTCVLFATDGYAADISTSASQDYGFLASSVTSGSASAKLCDYYFMATGNLSMRHGGGWWYGDFNGMFTNQGCTIANYDVSIGSRLMYIG